MCEVWKRIMRMNGKKDGVLMACYACLLVIGGLLTWLKYDYNAVKMEDVREACGYVSASATPVEAPKIALTFDDGPSTAWTPALLDGLKERGVKATFFLIGENADKNPEIVKRMAEEGHLIGNHTYSHIQLTSNNREAFRQELISTNEVLKEITGAETIFVRPPYGSWDKGFEQELNMFPVLWTIDPLDWCSQSSTDVEKRILSKARENAIILLHDEYASSIEAALFIVDELQSQGYVFVTVEEIMLVS